MEIKLRFTEEAKKNMKLAAYKNALLETDYIFIKSKEYEDTGKSEPYSTAYKIELSENRDILRNKINELENN